GRGGQGDRGRVRHQGRGPDRGGCGSGCGRVRWRGGGRGEDGVHGQPRRGGREQVQRDQGRARAHPARPQGGQGPGRRRAEAGAREREQGGRGEGGGEVEGSGGNRRNQVRAGG